jgi:DNA-binding response OmpR family regulator
MYILVVEDERKLAQVVRRVLEEEGHTVDIARDGEEGLAMAVEGSHDVIVLDVLLPMLDGIEVCRRLRASRVDTPVLLLTALGEVEDRVRGLDAGADDYCPLLAQELLARLRSVMRRVDAREPNQLTRRLVLTRAAARMSWQIGRPEFEGVYPAGVPRATRETS